jgi:membrane-bound ClpP family serine protease
VWVDGERWDATSEDGFLDDGTPIIVTSKRGLHLMVKRDPASIRLLPAGQATAEQT